MKIFTVIIIASVLYCSKNVQGDQTTNRVVCFYNATHRETQGFPFFFEKHLSKALPKCTHLVYSHAQILPESFEIQKYYNLSPKPRNVKLVYPHLKIFLSVGGDKPELTEQYLKFLEAGPLKQRYFIENVTNFLKITHFDGLDLAFPFPRNKPHKPYSSIDDAINFIKNIFIPDKEVDINAATHNLQYTKFVQSVKKKFLMANLQLSMTVLPNVNSSWYFDVRGIHKNFEFINLFAFDFLTPTRNPEEADYTSPIYFKEGGHRLPHYNIEFQVNHWIHNGCPKRKLNLGISTYGRAWKYAGQSGVPVVRTRGAAGSGLISQVPGLLSWTIICRKLAFRAVHKVANIYGTYAFHPADENGNNGLWISYDDPDFAGIKTNYVKKKGMGGVAVYDLQNDDFRNYCLVTDFPILSRISEGLGVRPQLRKFHSF